MNFAVPPDNMAGITRGGAQDLSIAALLDILHISNAIDICAECSKGAALSTSGTAGKEWKFPSECQVEQSIIEAAGGSQILAKLLVKRGLRTPADVQAFLDPRAYTASEPAELPDMGRAVARVMQAIESKERITIYGDYDVDGVTATAVMVTTLRKLGAEVGFYIPTRAEGYGLNLKAVSVMASKHRTKLVITCDCGISNFSEINFAKSLGVETIVVDHHTMPELMPPAVAILHPKRLPEEHKLFHMPGVGVAYKFAEALLLERELVDEVPKLLDFVTLGMIADMVPLTQECRYLVQVGMPWLVNSQRAGIKALLQQVGPRSDGGTDLVGFGLAPRINAVGRLSDANMAVKLMITDDEQEAATIAKQLETENLRRQELCEEIFAKADVAAAQSIRAGNRAIAIYDAGWHHGVVGIVASRLVEKYNCPVFIGEVDAAEGIVKGSARGVAGIDLYQVLKANEHLAMKWGGHKMAAGWSVEIEKVSLFCKGIVDTCNKLLADQSGHAVLDVDLEVGPSEVNEDLANLLAKLAPFGMGNKKPIIALREQACAGIMPLGREGKHARVTVETTDGDQLECVFWNTRGRIPVTGQPLDICFTPEMNTYKGNTRLQLLLSDWRDPRNPGPIASLVQPALAGTAGGGKASVSAAKAAVVSPNPAAPAAAVAPVSAAASATVAVAVSPVQTKEIFWKDLRHHGSPESLVQAAVRKLGNSVQVFGESCPKVEGIDLVDRNSMQQTNHLLIWNYPPNIQVFRGILEKSGATNVYVVGGAEVPVDDAATFIKRLLGIVRYAINQREGQADPEKIAAALGCSKMSLALGLTILKKVNLVDWFAEEGTLFLDLLGEPVGKPEQLLEFRQLANGFKDVDDFRSWCNEATLKELQLALVPAPINVEPAVAPPSAQPSPEFSGKHIHDANQLSSNL